MVSEIDTSRRVEKTFAIVKPDAVKKGPRTVDEIVSRIVEEEGFTIVCQEQMQLSRDKAQLFYREHEGKPFFDGLIDYMASGPVIALVLAKVDAIKSWRALMGPTDVDRARIDAPRSLRALYGTNKTFNAVHGSDSMESARREIKFFFPDVSIDPILNDTEASGYIQAHLHKTLVQGLTEMAKLKPEEPIKWLANWLLSNNPQRPSIVSTIHDDE